MKTQVEAEVDHFDEDMSNGLPIERDDFPPAIMFYTKKAYKQDKTTICEFSETTGSLSLLTLPKSRFTREEWRKLLYALLSQLAVEEDGQLTPFAKSYIDSIRTFLVKSDFGNVQTPW